MKQLSTRIASPSARLLFIASAVIAATLALTAQSPQPPKTAAEQFKNIQILKNVPADQIIPAMQFISSALNVKCEFCHVENAFDKDDKKEKKTARQMMTMMMAINKDNFKGEREVTCYTCHQGVARPVSTPVIKDEAAGPVEPPLPSDNARMFAPPTITADEIIAKYVQALGGRDALAKVTSRIQKGSLLAGQGRPMPVDIYTKAPDKRTSIVHMPTADSSTIVNGSSGWLVGGPRPPHEMNAAESAAALLDAQIFLGASPKDLFTDFRVGRPEKVGDKEVYVLMARREGQPPVRLYFDKQTNLLVRMLRLQETPLGRNPTQIDYADYRESNGLKIPFRWTIARPGSRFTIQVESVQQNVPINDSKFAKPEAPAAPPNAGPAAH